MRVRSVTKLQKLIAHSSAVDAIISHLQEVLNQYGPDGFKLLVEVESNSDHDNRMPMPVHQLGLENVKFKFLEANAKKIFEQFHEGMESEDAREAFVEIAEVFNSDQRFNQVMQHYYAAYPDSSEKLRNFLLAEAACCILETCMTCMNQPLFSKWRELQSDAQTNHNLNGMKEQQARIKKEIEDGILLLGNVRQAVSDYRHPEIQPRRRKISLTTKKLDPMSTDIASQELLAALIHSHPQVDFFDAVDPVTKKPVKYLVPDPAKEGVSRYVKLTQSLVRYRRKKSVEDRFAVCNSAPLGEGTFGVVYESTASLAIKPGIKGRLDRAVGKKKKTEKARVVKQFGNGRVYDADNVRREGEMLEKVMLLHAKRAVVSETQNRASIVMRKFKGRELIEHLMADWGDDYNVITRNTFTIDQRLALTVMIGEAIIKQVHENQLIHRDIKGDNIMVELDAQNNPLSAVVIDYGVAKHKGEKTSENVGTKDPIDYRAPEVVAAFSPSSDEKSDAYSFAILLKEIIWYNVMHGERYKDLTSKQKYKISEVIQRGIRAKSFDRATIQDMVNVFKEVRHQRVARPAVSDKDY